MNFFLPVQICDSNFQESAMSMIYFPHDASVITWPRYPFVESELEIVQLEAAYNLAWLAISQAGERLRGMGLWNIVLPTVSSVPLVIDNRDECGN